MLALLLLGGCGGGSNGGSGEAGPGNQAAAGCPAQYPDPAHSLYVLPWAAGKTVRTGLANCSSSFHSAGRPDQFAFDFDFDEGSPFVAARGGRVKTVVNTEPSSGGGGSTGNYVVIEHGDGTSGLYLHSPRGGILVQEGETVAQGQVLGVTGRSGYAGYPHLHFMVVQGEAIYPYVGVPVSFRNADPPDRVLRSYRSYRALAY
ncbi:M23 family metallopeptidase [Inhella sp.]|uniref:M23 family metallopeptidase n=1 Tax=Inhella sp. TaxID=1921806 RepID=UPI0035B322E6